MLFAQNNTLGKTILQKYSNCFLGVKKGCKSRNCLIYTLYCGERGIRKAKPSRGHISKNNPHLATQPPIKGEPLRESGRRHCRFLLRHGAAELLLGRSARNKKSDRLLSVAAAAFGSRRERLSNLHIQEIS